MPTYWSVACNDLIHRVCMLYPDNFVGVCQLPQSPGVAPANCIGELERYVDAVAWLTSADRQKIYEGNARKVYRRLDTRLSRTPAAART